MISLQTNVDALDALQNLNVDNLAQSNTIEQLSSGYRINKSGDDAAGLAVANAYQSEVTQLNQGVINANNGVAQLQIIDGGLANISTILSRMQTLATESASGTFTGSRATLNQEYQNLIGEITRQANNIDLNAGGSFNNVLNVYIGGGNNATNSQVTINLSGAANAVDANSLGLSTTNVLGGGVTLAGTQNLNDPDYAFGSGAANTTQAFTFYLYSSNGGAQTVTATVSTGASTTGITASAALGQLNSTLNPYGITASISNSGTLQFSGATAFNVSAAAASGGTGLASAGTAQNTSNYTINGQATYAAGAQTLTIQTSNGTANVSLLAGDNLAGAISKINAQTASLGVYAVENTAGTGISFQSENSFSVYASAAGTFAAAGNNTATAPTTGTSNNAQAAINAIQTAIANLGLVQGVVGAGENQLQYAINLAQSQITNVSTAESNIKDANVAQDASNLTKSQVLEQTAIAALAQANSEPQAVLKLLQG